MQLFDSQVPPYISSVVSLASAAARRLVIAPPAMQTFGSITEVIVSAAMSLVAAAAVHHAPALGRLHALNFGAVAAACARGVAEVNCAEC